MDSSVPSAERYSIALSSGVRHGNKRAGIYKNERPWNTVSRCENQRGWKSRNSSQSTAIPRWIGKERVHCKWWLRTIPIIWRPSSRHFDWPPVITNVFGGNRTFWIGWMCSHSLRAACIKKCSGVSSPGPTKSQHQGFGKLLMEEAERKVKEHGSRRIAVT